MKNTGCKSAGEILRNAKPYILEAEKKDKFITEFRDVDALTGGFGEGEMICIAGRPSMGKTGLALSILERGCVNGGKSCLFFL